jgi:hypothetical protein
MKRLDAANLVRLCAGLIVALVLGDVVSPSAAQAGCGDHVRMNREGAANNLDPHPATPASPCHGIFCSQQPDPTPLAPATPRLIVPDVWDRLAEQNANTDPTSAGWLPLEQSGPPFRLATSIFHPPR